MKYSSLISINLSVNNPEISYTAKKYYRLLIMTLKALMLIFSIVFPCSTGMI